MLKHSLPLAALVLTSCSTQGMDAVSIRPIYGWVDGCTDVQIGGHDFGNDVSVTIGGNPLANLTLPTEADAPLDVGFEIYGTTPASTNGKGVSDVVVTTGGVSDTIKDGFYYVDCPAIGYIEAASPTEGVSSGDTITMMGCGMDASAYTVRVGDATTDAQLTSVCSSATVTFTAPAPSTDGTWYVGFFDSTGTQVSPDPACDITQPAGSITNPDTGDTGWVDPCSGALAITYGGK